MSKRRWTSYEEKLLKEQLSKTGSIDGVFISGRTRISVSGKARRMGLTGDGIPRKQWPDDHCQELIRLCGKGLSAKDIHEQKLLPYSKNSIQKKMGRLSLSKKVKSFYRLSDRQLERLEKFLHNMWSEYTPQEISDIWNSKSSVYGFKINRRKVVYHLSRLGIKKPQSEILKMSLSRKK